MVVLPPSGQLMSTSHASPSHTAASEKQGVVPSLTSPAPLSLEASEPSVESAVPAASVAPDAVVPTAASPLLREGPGAGRGGAGARRIRGAGCGRTDGRIPTERATRAAAVRATTAAGRGDASDDPKRDPRGGFGVRDL